ncbi:HAMP domain-containing histidine kinase [Flavihumibacter rivuli]|uniref:sensor histidine kinase n=1 Tax=Flavihumibacter rivuli TaxID=2838156 RepID=UPI001BDE49B5|nr:HAMP domain-containing sensor histidine kinase [Flavihumibacter rivuli]ULQ56932.1 HAMP domain-containing histidine kinase [Flavihumibacter rivuli]
MRSFVLQVLKRNAYYILAAAWLFTIAFIINNYFAGASSARYLRTGIEERIQQQEVGFKDLVKDTLLFKVLSNGSYQQSHLDRVTKLPYGLFIYRPQPYGNWQISFWNTQQVLPNSDIIYSSASSQFIQLQNGQYVFIRKELSIGKEKRLVVALLPVRSEYFIQNKNLKRSFAGFPQAESSVATSVYETEFPVKSISGEILFFLQPRNIYANQNSNEWSLLLTVIGVMLLLMALHHAAVSIVEEYGFFKGFLFLFLTVVVLRWATFWFSDIFSWRTYELFDPSIYSSSSLLPSLGDLLINVFLFCWLMLFLYRRVSLVRISRFGEGFTRNFFIACAAIILLGTTFSFAYIIKTLISDARISFNVTNFFSLDIYSFYGFIVLTTLALSYFLLSSFLLKTISPLKPMERVLLYSIMAVAGLSFLTFMRNSSLLELYIFVLLWLIGYVWLMKRPFLLRLGERWNLSVALLWMFVYSASIAVIIQNENRRIEIDQRKRTAEKLALRADPSSERLLSIALTYFDNDFLLDNFYRFGLASANQYLKDSLINKNFSAYLNKYDTRIYTFDNQEQPLYNNDPISYDTLNTIFMIEGKPTNVVDLRYFEKAFDKFSYISKKTVTDTIGSIVGYMFILSEPKKYKSDALVPELFRSRKDFMPDEYSPVYSYAIYNNKELLDYYNEYAFPIRLADAQLPKNNFTQRRNGDYDELWFRDNNKVVVIARRDNLWLESITLVAYLFSSFLLLMGVYRIITVLMQSRLKLSAIRQRMQLNLRIQIHTIIISISIFSFLVIGATTIFFFINRYNKNKQDQLSRAIQIIASEVQSRMVNKEVFSDMVRLYEEGANEALETLSREVAEIHGTDFNLYDLNGELKVSSNPFIYDKGILSVRMNPDAYFNMHRKRLVQFATQEEIVGISYHSIYAPVRDEEGNPYAYLNMPSFDSQVDLKREISNFLVTIINLNAFIFLLAGVIAVFITNRITSSFSLISEKMRAVSLGQHNEAIEWNREDEIGELVKEYNKMVNKLEESAVALAKSEREGAWREMARQVAHEIKNPLTPMKLSIQYLQKAIDSNTGDVKQLTSNVARTLVEQIDHLSKIASEFSQFANISNARIERFDLHDVLYSLSHLYESNEQLEFSWKPVHRQVMLNADKTQINRLFTNLLQNAVEATQGLEHCVVTVEEELRDLVIVVKVSDNGSGIPEATQSRIFTPNFTTKTSGTGLGLAMCKGIVEQAHGRIWFETNEGKGTTFYVELPIEQVS